MSRRGGAGETLALHLPQSLRRMDGFSETARTHKLFGGDSVQSQSGNRAPGVFVSANDGSKPLAVMRHAEAERLIRNWAAAELSEIRRCWYPPAAMGYRDYVAPRDPEERQEREIRRVERDDFEISRTGWVVLSLREPHRSALVRFYRGGDMRVGGRARNAALAAFVSRWSVWSEAVDGPLNSI